MQITTLTSAVELETAIEQSFYKVQLFFKHSTTCSISKMVFDRIKRNWTAQHEILMDFNYIDLLTYRELSNTIATRFSIRHESPQVLLVKDGQCFYHASHNAINLEKILNEFNAI